MTQKLTSLLLITVLLCSTLALSGCSATTTLNRIGPSLTALGGGFDSELLLLRDAGLITPAKYAEVLALDLSGKARTIGEFLTTLGAITGANKAEVMTKIAAAVRTFQQMSGVVPAGSVASKILTAIVIGLQSASLAVGVIVPPKPRAGAVGTAEAGVSTAGIKVKLNDLPKETVKYFR